MGSIGVEYRYILALGSNLGNRAENLKFATAGLKKHGIVLKESGVVDTEPLKHNEFETKNDPYYLNSAIDFHSHLSPNELYDVILHLENSLDRDRSRRWLPRALDIDILLMARHKYSEFTKNEALVWSKNELFIPHLELVNRLFLRDLLLKLYIDSKCLLAHGVEFKIIAD